MSEKAERNPIDLQTQRPALAKMLERCAQGTLPNSIHQPARKAHRRFGGLGVGYHVLSMRISEFGSAGSRLAKLRRAAQRPYPFHWELGFAALVLLAWQLVGFRSKATSLTRLPRTPDPEPRITSLDRRRAIRHPPRIGSRAQPPSPVGLRKPSCPSPIWFLGRSTFASAGPLPATANDLRPVLSAGVFRDLAYLTAPPRWIPEIGLGQAPSQAESSNTLGALVQNSTAAAASQHFGIALFVACGSLWAFPYSRLALATMAYPVFVFTVIVGTGNHYVLDCVVGAAAFRTRHNRRAAAPPPIPRRAVTGYADGGRRDQQHWRLPRLAWAILSLGSPATAFWTSTAPGLLALLFGLAVLSRPCDAASAFSSSEVGPA